MKKTPRAFSVLAQVLSIDKRQRIEPLLTALSKSISAERHNGFGINVLPRTVEVGPDLCSTVTTIAAAFSELERKDQPECGTT